MRIAAVVNDEVISVFDLVSRMRMVMISSNMPDTPETRQRIATQVLRSLIDEKLELQEAKKQERHRHRHRDQGRARSRSKSRTT